MNGYSGPLSECLTAERLLPSTVSWSVSHEALSSADASVLLFFLSPEPCLFLQPVLPVPYSASHGLCRSNTSAAPLSALLLSSWYTEHTD